MVSLSKVLAEVSSPVSGTIRVVERFGRRQIVTRDKLGIEFTQSGAIVGQIWESVIKFHLKKVTTPRVLLMGLGGGTLVDLISSFKPEAAIDVVELDSIMLTLATEFFDLDPMTVNIYVDSAETFVRQLKNEAYDLICVDLFCHSAVPGFIENENWLRQVRRVLSTHGVVIFNRLAFADFGKPSYEFLNKLRTVFTIEEVVKKPSAFFASNILIVCSVSSV